MQDNQAYFAARERAERKAALNAADPTARVAHTQLADSYAEKAKAAEPAIVEQG